MHLAKLQKKMLAEPQTMEMSETPKRLVVDLILRILNIVLWLSEIRRINR